MQVQEYKYEWYPQEILYTNEFIRNISYITVKISIHIISYADDIAPSQGI